MLWRVFLGLLAIRTLSLVNFRTFAYFLIRLSSYY